MAAMTMQTTACVLSWRAETESHRPLVLFSAEQGVLTVYHRRGRLGSAKAPAPLDLFDEAEVFLASSNEGRTWFLQEARVLKRRASIGRSYEALSHASAFTGIVSRNPSSREGWGQVAELLGQALDAFASEAYAPEIVYLKALYSFARGEGHPVSRQWAEQLQEPLQKSARLLLHRPLAEISETKQLRQAAVKLRRRLEDYLSGNTEMLMS